MARILIVDDEKSIRRTLGEFLRQAGYAVDEAEDAEVALKQLSETAFDVVVSDIILPRVTGVELLRRIHEISPHVQVIMMTGEPTVETATEALRAGAVDYLSKPINKAAILRVVANAVRIKLLEDTRRRLEAENQVHRENLERLVQERTAQLRESETRARELSRFNQGALDALTAHLCVLAGDGTILAVNHAWTGFIEANPPAARNASVGANYFAVCDAVAGTDRPAAQEAVSGLRAVVRGEMPEYSLEYPCHSPNEQRWFLLRATRFAGEGPVRIVVAHVNITERKQAESELERNHERYRRAIIAANATPYQKEYGSDTYVFMGEGIKEMTGYAASELRASVWKDIILETVLLGEAAGLTPAEASHRAMTGQLKSWHADHRIRRRDGEIRWISDSSVSLLDAHGKYLGSLGILQDITERKRAEDLLRESEERFRSLYENALMGLYRTTPEGRIVLANPALVRMLGYGSFEELARQNLERQGFHPDHPRREFKELLEREDHVQGLESAWTRADGATVFVRESARAVRDEAGRVLYFDGVVEDITEQKRAERVTASFARLGWELSSTSEATQAARVVADVAQELIGWDCGFIELRSEDLQRIEHALHWDTLAGKRVEVPPTNVSSTPTPSEQRFRSEGAFLVLRDPVQPDELSTLPFGDEAHRSESLLYVPLRYQDRYLGMFSVQSYKPRAYTRADLDLLQALADHCAGALERIRTEARLRKLARAVEHSPVSIVITDRSGNIEFVNPKFIEVSGYTAEEVIGRNTSLLKSGETPSEEYRRLWETITAGQEWRGEFRNRRKDGTLFWESISVSPMHDSAGEITHFIAVKEDVTEKRMLEAQFLRAQRMESIGTLAGGVAHDLNNILAPIMMATSLLREETTSPGTVQMLELIQTNSQRAADIIKQLLTFARGVEGERILLQPKHLVREILKIAGETFPKSIQLRNQVSRELWPVRGDATQFHQVLLNLCVNARDAMPEGGTLTIAARNVMLDSTQAAALHGLKPGPHVLIEVADTGHGIPPEVLERIFDPFFTTKPLGKGTGLGLSTVLGIARSHGGCVNVVTEMNRGTTFQVYFPAHPEGQTEAAPPQPVAVPTGQGETILVVDDEAGIRKAMQRVLKRHGYQVLLATNGAEALTLFAQQSDRIRLVLTDLMMPVMDGLSLVRELRKIAPAVQVIASTGVTESDEQADRIAQLKQLGVTSLLIKPYVPDQMLTAVHRMLHNESRIEGTDI